MNIFSAHRTIIMGIVNATPDSFYDGGLHADADSACAHALSLLSEGADIIDIGGESSRPGAGFVTPEEEISRVIPVIERVLGKAPEAFISVDTWKSEVAEAALNAGAKMINDISGFTADDKMCGVCAAHDAYAVLMHMRGTPQTMQDDLVYEDCISEIEVSLRNSIHKALAAGVRREKIVIDPGIGFSKSVEQNYLIINNVARFKKMGYPVLIGLSRKSLIGKVIPEGADRLPATIALDAVSVMNGADIIRVHDVKDHVLVRDVIEMLKRVSA